MWWGILITFLLALSLFVWNCIDYTVPADSPTITLVGSVPEEIALVPGDGMEAMVIKSDAGDSTVPEVSGKFPGAGSEHPRDFFSVRHDACFGKTEPGTVLGNSETDTRNPGLRQQPHPALASAPHQTAPVHWT